MLRREGGQPLTSRGRRTRAALVQAGREVFEEVGFGDARVDLVCARAAVSHGTFYTYFESKESLFREVVAAVVGDMFTATRVGHAVPGDDPYARIEAANRLYLQAVTRNSVLLRVFDQVAAVNEEFRRLRLEVQEMFASRAADGLLRLQEAGVADPALPPDVAGSALGAMVERFAHVWLDQGRPVDEETAVRTLTRLWAGAIRLQVPPGPG